MANKKSQLNDYEEALTSIIPVLGDFTRNQNFSVFGFGARSHLFNDKSNNVSQFFPINLDGGNDPFCVGVEGDISWHPSHVRNFFFISLPILFLHNLLFRFNFKVC